MNTIHRSRVLIIAADGADPGIAARLMSEGQMPHLTALCRRGVWGPLQTTFPPVSPAAWMTCLSGVSPADHGIHDFVIKARGSYHPDIGLFEARQGASPIPLYTSRRTAPTLTETLARHGKKGYLLQVPATFPPPPTGYVLAGLGMPDLAGTFGMSAWYTTDAAAKRAAAPEGGDWVQPLKPVGGNVWSGEIFGPASASLPFLLYRQGERMTLSLQTGAAQDDATLAVGEWSGWLRPVFNVPQLGAIPGLCRFKLIADGPTVELYRTPVQCAPDLPLFPLCEPARLSIWLQKQIGPFATIGMPADLDGVRRGVVDHETWLQDAYFNWDRQVAMALRLMAEPDWDLLMLHLFTLDNVQHLFWHTWDERHPAHPSNTPGRRGEIERAYRWIDEQIGRLAAAAGPDTTLMVISDHGGLPIYRQVYINAWLRLQGHLSPLDDDTPGRAIRIDWARTRAAMLGTGSIWLNVQGREPQGIVPPGVPYESLRQEIRQHLLNWHDPDTAQPIVENVLSGEDVFGRPARRHGPDLVLALYPGYGLGRGESIGQVMSGRSLVSDNLTAWSGGHEGPYLPHHVPGLGVFCGPGFENATWPAEIGLQDIAPAVLYILDVPPS